MTVEEIKNSHSMRDIVAGYGVEVNRGGMCCCPFHGEKHPSMKIYDTDFHCFACGKHGDIFTWVMLYEKCNFITAFKLLGGSTELANKDIVYLNSQRNARYRRQREANREKEIRDTLSATLELVRELETKSIPLSDEWAELCNEKNYLENIWQEKYIDGNEVNGLDVYRRCEKLRQRYTSINRTS